MIKDDFICIYNSCRSQIAEAPGKHPYLLMGRKVIRRGDLAPPYNLS